MKKTKILIPIILLFCLLGYQITNHNLTIVHEKLHYMTFETYNCENIESNVYWTKQSLTTAHCYDIPKGNLQKVKDATLFIELQEYWYFAISKGIWGAVAILLIVLSIIFA